MSRSEKVAIAGLVTGIPGLDDILGGQGLPEYSFNIIAGPPGSGKTTLAQQIMFAQATPERPALFFTALGEPTMKMMRYMQQLSFFDLNKVGDAVRFVNLSDEALAHGLDGVLAKIVEEVVAAQPAIVVVDSFRTMMGASRGDSTHLEGFIQRLAQQLTTWQATTFLVGEYTRDDRQENPIFTVADGLLWLWQSAERNSVVRKLQIGKMRGRAPTPGQHTFRITEHGIRVFPRKSTEVACAPVTAARRGRAEPAGDGAPRQSTGVPGLDRLANGGLQPGSSVLVAGPAGSGKTILSSHFLAAGLARGETAVAAIFEEHPDDYLARADGFGLQLGRYVGEGKLTLIGSHPLDLSIDETLYELHRAASAIGARRVVIDSLSGLELAVAANFQEEYRESLYRLVSQLTQQQVTVWMTCEVVESFGDLKFTPHAISFLTDVIIVQRYIELEGRLQKMLSVVKMRRSKHSDELCRYEIGCGGISLGETFAGYCGVVTGVPRPSERAARSSLGLQDTLVLQALVALGPASRDALVERSGVAVDDLGPVVMRLKTLRYVKEMRTAADTFIYSIGKIPSEG